MFQTTATVVERFTEPPTPLARIGLYDSLEDANHHTKTDSHRVVRGPSFLLSYYDAYSSNQLRGNLRGYYVSISIHQQWKRVYITT